MKKFIRLTLAVMFSLMLGLMTFMGTAAASGPAQWGYEGAEGPEYWGELSPDHALCSTGQEQSPVDIPATAAVSPADIAFNYQPSAMNILNNGHTIQANYDPGSSIEVDGKTYHLLQFHFHALSEHTIEGQPSPLEMHLVHQSDDGNFAVVGVMINHGTENPALAPVWDNLPVHEDEPATIAGVTVVAGDLLPSDRAYYHYEGSFTTPPCTEGVKWFVLANPIEVSEAQAAAFEQFHDNNYRPVQPFNARTFHATDQIGPETLPESGGPGSPLAVILLSLGATATVVGLYLRRRRSPRL